MRRDLPAARTPADVRRRICAPSPGCACTWRRSRRCGNHVVDRRVWTYCVHHLQMLAPDLSGPVAIAYFSGSDLTLVSTPRCRNADERAGSSL